MWIRSMRDPRSQTAVRAPRHPAPPGSFNGLTYICRLNDSHFTQQLGLCSPSGCGVYVCSCWVFSVLLPCDDVGKGSYGHMSF